MDDKLNETVNNNKEGNEVDLEKKETSETPVISLEKEENTPEEKEEVKAEPAENTAAEPKTEEAAAQASDTQNEAKAEEKPAGAPKQGNAAGAKSNSTDMKKPVQFQTVDLSGKNKNAEPEKKKGSVLKKAGIAVAALFVLYVVFAAVFSIGQKYERPVNNYYKAIEKGDGKYLEKAFGSVVEEEIDEMLKENKGKSKKYSDIDSASDVYTAAAVSMHKDYMETYGTGFKIKVEVTGKEKMKKDELKKINEKLKKKDVDHKVKKGYYLRTNTVLKSKESNRDIESKDLVEVFLIDNEWVFFDDSILKADDLSSFEGILRHYDNF